MELKSSTCSPSISPQPPPVFKSNKVTPLEESTGDLDEDGIINDICETVDETMFSIEAVEASDEDGSKDSGRTDVSSITGVYELTGEPSTVKNSDAETKESIHLSKSTLWEEQV